jgi:hypothetical protein
MLMFDPVTFVLALGLIGSASLYIRARRRRAKWREFDGGFSHENDVHVTRILSPHITTVKGDRD